MDRILSIHQYNRSKNTWIVVDCNTYEVLSIAAAEIFVAEKMDRQLVYEPLQFKDYQSAEEFVQGKMSIGSIQESTMELNVRFTGNFIQNSLQQLMLWNKDFAERVFPDHCDNPTPPLHHLKKEVKELIESYDNVPFNREETLEEYADCLILLTGSAIRQKFSAYEIIKAAFDKMEKNEARDWGEPDENGVYQHKE